MTMVALNLLMVASFMQGMSESGTVIATALSTGFNFSVSVCSIHRHVVFIFDACCHVFFKQTIHSHEIISFVRFHIFIFYISFVRLYTESFFGVKN